MLCVAYDLPPRTFPSRDHQVAAGGLQIAATMGANVGPQVYVFNFTSVGIAINGGHEAMVGCCFGISPPLLLLVWVIVECKEVW